jgi:signal transduction histidine kinase/DNA-binding response OmpR family regulator/ligand-binding sensor domain-containing protein
MRKKPTSRIGAGWAFRQFSATCGFTIFLFFCLGSIPNSLAQEVHFEHITVNDGLAHSDALDVVQGSNGFMWIATNNGVDRYDGYDLKHYRLPPSSPTGVTSNRVHFLFVDLNGVLWAGTENAGIFYFDQRTDQFYRPVFRIKPGLQDRLLKDLNRANVKSIAMDQSHRIWVATMGHGVFCLQTGKDNIISSIQKVALGTNANQNYAATTLFASMPGQIWIGTLEQGLWLVDSSKKPIDGEFTASEVKNIPEKKIRVVRQDDKSNIWIASDRHIYRIRPGLPGGQREVRKLPGIFDDIQCLYSDSFDHLWIGSNSGLKMIEYVEGFLSTPSSEKIHSYDPDNSEPSGINAGKIHRIAQDNFGNLWLAASDGGINKIRLKAKGFHILSRKVANNAMLANNFVNAIARDEARQRLWMGTRNGYSVFDERSGSYANFLTATAKEKGRAIEVSAFCQSGSTMWVGTRYSGLYLAKTDRLQNPIAFGKLAGLPEWNHISVESIVSDNKGQVWVGTIGAGLILFTKEGRYLCTYNRNNSSIPSNNISFQLYDPSQDVVWMSSLDQGVLKMQEQNKVLHLRSQFKHDPGNENSLNVNFAWPLARDKAGNIWVGTIGGGLHQVHTQNGRQILRRYQHLVPDSDIESILTDQKGNLWIAGAGLKKFTPETGELINFDVNDGLQSNSFKVGSAFASTSGTMYFGGTNGITWFKPGEIRPTPAPMVRITGMRVLNKNLGKANSQEGSSMVNRAISETERVVIHAEENDFSFEFVGINYVNARKQTYAYMLQGYSENWIRLPEGQRTASFANLPAGDYIFRVKANNGEGIWSVSPASVLVTVLPPWWKTWWAYSLYFLALSAALYWYRNLTTSRLKLENKLSLEKLKSENEHKIAEMKANFFTGVSHELRTPLTLIVGPMEKLASSYSESGAFREEVLMMHKQTRKLLYLVNQLLNFRKVETGKMPLSAARQNIIELIVEIFSVFKIKADEFDVEYGLDLPSQDVRIYFDPEKLEVIVTNLLSNAFKYSRPGGKIQLSVNSIGSPESDAVWNNKMLADHYLEISVVDTGTGIHEDDQEKIFDPYFQASNNISFLSGSGIGLALVKEFVERHSGEIALNSKIGAGSKFIVRLPFGKKHLLPSELTPILSVPDVSQKQSSVVYEDTQERSSKDELYKILIVEDNPDLRHYLHDLFRDDYQVFLCADGAEGWEKATQILPDLILSDVNMPIMSGLELSKKIRQNQKTAHIPVILLTALTAAIQELEGLETGADDYIVKPFNEEILKAKVSNFIHSRQRLQQYYHRQILLEPNEIVIADQDKLLLEKAMGIVESNLTDRNFNVQSLVNQMNMSQSVFYRRIKSITGQTVIEFIRDVRLKNAAQLLKNPHVRISEVAAMVGMEDVRNFRIFFQKRYNCLPSVYAKTYRNTPTAAKSEGNNAYEGN